MEVIGLVAEYNPLHNGHIYQINKIKEMFPNSLLIVILNGYFMERGNISYLTKKDKVKYALSYGVDIVVELPTIYGLQSADTFAYQSIKILNELHINKLIFGSESNDLDMLKNIAKKQEDNNFNNYLKEELNKGVSYPIALKNALNINFEILPNDLLGISYIKAINKVNKSIIPISIKRTNEYHDIISNDEIISAENIRNKFDNNININKYTPVNNLIKPNYDLYFNILKIKILTDAHLNEYEDVYEGIENRLIKYINEANNIEEFINLIKTKRYSYNKISRMLIHILLGFKKIDNKDLLSLRILGFNNKGKKYIKDNNIINIINKDIKNFELKSSKIYDILTNSNTYNFEIRNIPIQK